LAFTRIPTLACSGLTQPAYDFAGNTIQDFLDMQTPLLNLSFTPLPNESGGIAVFVWLKKSDSLFKPFVSSLLSLPDTRLTDALVQLVFDSFENHAIEPTWWEELPKETVAEIGSRILNWAAVKRIDRGALIVGDRNFDDWGFNSAIWF
jgi:hypothetical protein